MGNLSRETNSWEAEARDRGEKGSGASKRKEGKKKYDKGKGY